jgi:hypothetical protein
MQKQHSRCYGNRHQRLQPEYHALRRAQEPREGAVSGTSDGAVARKRIGGFHTAEERLIAVLKREEILS